MIATSLFGPLRIDSAASPNANEMAGLPFMQRAYHSTGGVIMGDAFSELLRNRVSQPISTLARWIVRREVVHFKADGQIWLPMFQFDPVRLHVRPTVERVVEELGCAFDDRELAEWFARPNSWLGEAIPAELIGRDGAEVMHAARADRFIATG